MAPTSWFTCSAWVKWMARLGRSFAKTSLDLAWQIGEGICNGNSDCFGAALSPWRCWLRCPARQIAAGQTFDEAVAAYDRGDYATAVRGFLVHAEQGEASDSLRSERHRMITLPWHELVSWCIALKSATLFTCRTPKERQQQVLHDHSRAFLKLATNALTS